MRGRITKRAIDALEVGEFLWDTEIPGFGCKAVSTGRVYVLQYRPRTQADKRQTAPKRITLGKHGRQLTPDQARSMAAELLLEVRSGSDPAQKLRSSDSPTVATLFERFLDDYLPGKKRPPRASTIAFYETLARCHVLPRLGTTRVDAVSAGDIERLHSGMRDSPYAANRTLSMLQQAFDQAERLGWRAQHSNPATHIDRYPESRRGAKREVMLDPEGMRRLMGAVQDEENSRGSLAACAAIRVAFWTGWRIGEVLALEWANLDFAEGRARRVKTKTAPEEYRQLPDEAIAVLSGQIRVAGCPYVFPGRDLSHHLTHVRKPWARIRQRAGLGNLEGLGAFRLHDLRHNVVSWDVSRGVPLEIAGRNVGHRSRRSTEVYAHFAPTALKRAADERAAAMRGALEGERNPMS